MRKAFGTAASTVTPPIPASSIYANGKQRFAVESPLIGKINVYNILAACAAGISYDIAPDVIARGIAQLRAVPGRFERVDEGQPFVVVVDYAHTDDALRNVIAVARSLGSGKTVKDIASAGGVSRNAILTHLRGVMEKTGCNRQADIVALLTTISPARLIHPA